MALDHYVSQVHLKKFYAPQLHLKKMFAFRKSDGNTFPCGSEDVCRIDEGSTNPFVMEPRVLEEFLRKIEPFYSQSCDRLACGRFDPSDIFVIAGFAAFVIGCSPTAMRLGCASLGNLAHAELLLLDRMGQIDPPPPELGSESLPELLEQGKLVVRTDAKFPQALGISTIVDQANAFATYHWEILLNPNFIRSPFLTSDFPAAIEVNLKIPANRIIPLRPDLAVRIIPQIRPKSHLELQSDFRYQMKKLSPSEVTAVNRIIVRSAENLVFSPINGNWASRMVHQNARYRLELEHSRTAKGTGFLLVNQITVFEGP